MAEIIENIRLAVEVGWPFVLTAIVVALALHAREVQTVLLAELRERIDWLEEHCLPDPPDFPRGEAR